MVDDLDTAYLATRLTRARVEPVAAKHPPTPLAERTIPST